MNKSPDGYRISPHPDTVAPDTASRMRDSMTMPILALFIISSLLMSGCANTHTRTSEPIDQTRQRTTRGENAASVDTRQRPPAGQSQERLKQKEAASANRIIERRQAEETTSIDATADSGATAQPKQEEQMARLAPRKGEGNARQQAESVTPLDQSASEDDVAVTQRIRQALLKEDLSFAAKNVLVITEADRVVLKGQVRSQAEAERIKGIAGTMTTKGIEDVLKVTP